MTASGITLADRPNTVIVRSLSVPVRSAASTPPRIPSGTTITSARSASFNERTSASQTKSPTGVEYWYEVPRSPVTTPPAQSR